MLPHIPDVLAPAQVAHARAVLDRAEWVDGRATAGHQSAAVKNNAQLPEGGADARDLGAVVLGALERSPSFITAALPLRVFPPLFNRYGPGHAFGAHVDGATRQVAGTPHRVRTDLSCTLFLAGPDEYDGGELVVEDTYGEQRVKLPAGHAVLYPATSLHRVEPVTRGVRLASLFWTQSMVRDDGQRTLLFDLDTAINGLRGQLPVGHASPVQLAAVHHNLIRRWADA